MRLLAFVDAGDYVCVLRIVEIAKSLERSGLRITFVGSGPFLHIADEEGFRVEPIPHLSSLRQQLENDCELCRQLKPAMIIFSGYRLARIIGEVLNISTTAIINSDESRFQIPYKQPFDWLPPEIASAARNWRYYRQERKLNATHYKDLVHLRKELQLAELMGQEHEEGQLTLISASDAMFGEAELPLNVYLSGPILIKETGEAQEIMLRIDRHQSCVYMNLGNHTDPLIKKLGLQLAASDRQFIVASPTSIKDLPDGFLIDSLLTSQRLLKKCTVYLCTGQEFDVYRAIAAGLPIVCLTHDAKSRNIGAQITRLGLGVTLRLSGRMQSQKLLKKIEIVIREPHYAASVKTFSEKLTHGEQRGAELICSWLHPGEDWKAMMRIHQTSA